MRDVTALPNGQTPMTTPKPEEERIAQIGALLANQLDQMLVRYKTFDQKVLTEGEVMTAIGCLIGSHCKSRERVEEWLRNVATVAFHQQLIKSVRK